MIVQKDFLGKLKDFGLNSYEAKLWTALLSRGVATAGELSDIANVPRSRSYDVLESLERKGFVIMKLGKPIKYIAVPPKEVLERVKKNIQENAEKHIKQLENLKNTDILKSLSSLHEQGVDLVEPEDLTGAVKGRANLYNHLLSTIKNAEKTISLITTEQGLIRKFDTLKTALKKAKERGVKIRISAPITKNNQSLAKELSKFASVKNHSGPQLRACIVDGKTATIMVLDDAHVHPNYDFGIWVNAHNFARSLDNIFNEFWDRGKPVK